MPQTTRSVIPRWGASMLAVTLSLGTVVSLSARHAESKPPSKAPTKAGAAPSSVTNDNTPLTEEQKIVHVLNRLGFGPRPGDITRVKQMGLSNYITQQLYPEKIDDTAVDAKLADLQLLQQSSEELAKAFYNRQKGVVKLAKAREKMEQGQQKDATMTAVGGGTAPAEMTPEQRAGKLRDAMESLTPEEREELRTYQMAQQKIRLGGTQLAIDKTVRAVESERQLQEVLTDFWSNHFNIDISKGACATYKIADERDVVRKHLFGKFRDLLGASAKSAAMLIYLDNAQSVAPVTLTPAQERRQLAALDRLEQSGNPDAPRLIQAAKTRRKAGLNENYAREVMELHTLGVDGGYTQKDVQEVARCLTGWTIDRQTGEFTFTANRHDKGEKTVLGTTIPANGGIQDGETVLDMLASHPSTMRHISEKICRRFVADEPPKSLVDKCVATWKRTDGDLREIYRTIFTSPEFYSRAAYHQKIKSPFEYAISSIRVLGGTIEIPPAVTDGIRLALNNRGNQRNAPLGRMVVGQVSTMGQQLYRCQPPTGWTEDSRKWVSSGALIARLNYSLLLAGRKLADVAIDPSRLPSDSDPKRLVDTLAVGLLGGEISPSTRATLLKQATTTPQDANVAATTDNTTRLIALTLGSPEFQRR